MSTLGDVIELIRDIFDILAQENILIKHNLTQQQCGLLISKVKQYMLCPSIKIALWPRNRISALISLIMVARQTER